MGADYYLEVVSRFMADSGLDRDTCDYVLETFIHQTALIVSEFEAAYGSENYALALDLIHRLKGSSGNVRANELMAQALDIEIDLKQGDYKAVAPKFKVLLAQLEHLKQ